MMKPKNCKKNFTFLVPALSRLIYQDKPAEFAEEAAEKCIFFLPYLENKLYLKISRVPKIINPKRYQRKILGTKFLGSLFAQ